MNHYPATFRTYITQGIEHLLTQVETCTGQLPEALQRSAFHLMRYAFKVEGAWQALCKLLLQLAPKITLAAIPDDWTNCLTQAIALSQSRNDLFLLGRLCLDRGYIYQRNGDLLQAKTHYQQAALCFQSINDSCRYALSLSRLANIQRMMGQFEDARVCLENAINRLPSDDPFLVLTYMTLGWVAYDRSEWSASQKYFEFALQLSQKVGDKQREAHLLRDIGSSLQAQSQFDLAIEKYQEAIVKLEAIEDAYDLALTKMNLGVVYLHMEQWDCALEWLIKAHPYFQQFNDISYLGMSYTNQAIAIRGLGNSEKALELFSASVDLFERLEDTFRVVNGLDEIGVTYLQINQKDEAKKYCQNACERLQPLLAQGKYLNKYEEILRHLDLCKS